MPLTQEQREQFWRMGCYPRCLMRIAEVNGHPLTEDQFCDRFGVEFIDQADNFGMLKPDRVPFVHQAMGLPIQISGPNDFGATLALWTAGVAHLLIFTKKDLRPEHRHEDSRHASVLKNIGVADFSLWTPTQNGGHDDYDNLTPAEWIEVSAAGHFLF